MKPFASHRSFYQNKVELNLKNWEDFYALAVVFCGRMLRKEVFFGIISRARFSSATNGIFAIARDGGLSGLQRGT